MKKIGIIGGLSWLSTIEYYKHICLLSHQHQIDRLPDGPPAIPEMAIESLNINKSTNMRGTLGDEESWANFDAYFNAAFKRLELAGAEVAFIASNTPHNRLKTITNGISIPVVSIFEAVSKYCSELGIEETLILGTAPTMASPVFPAVLETYGIKGVTPASDKDEAAIVQLISQLHTGDVQGAENVIAEVVNDNASQFKKSASVCLSCTELPLAFTDSVDKVSFEKGGVLYLNTTVIHATAVFEYASGIQL